MTKVLIVVDYQNDFVTGSLGFEGAEALDDIICEKIKRYSEEGEAVIYTCDTHTDGYLATAEGRRLPVEHCIRGTSGWEIYGKVGQMVGRGSAVFRKDTFGCLALGNYLDEMQYKEVELCGLVSDICVFSNAVIAKAALPEAKIFVDARATGSSNREMQEKAFDMLENLHIDVINR